MTNSLKRFTIERGKWYAMEYLHGDDPDAVFEHFSPIYVFDVVPKKSGRGYLDLDFWHLNYPLGVNRKVYSLRTLHRAVSCLVSTRADQDGPAWARPTVIIKHMSEGWLQRHSHLALEDLEREGRNLEKMK